MEKRTDYSRLVGQGGSGKELGVVGERLSLAQPDCFVVLYSKKRSHVSHVPPGKGEGSEVVPRANLWSLSSAQLLGGRHVRMARALEPAGPGFASCVAIGIRGLGEIYVSTLSSHICIS